LARPGCFITLEGGEGAGKSTQARLLADALQRHGHSVLRTREPGGAPGAEVLRGLLLAPPVPWSLATETLLHFAARAEHVGRTIRPALAVGNWVVCDRFADSTLVYQGWAQGGNRSDIVTLTEMIGLRPDLTLVLDVSVETSLARLARRGAPADRYESAGTPFLSRVREGFRAVAEAAPERCALIDAEVCETTVAASIWAAVVSRLSP
jgi:dTMP kinase